MSEIVNCISEASAPLSLRLRWSSLFFATACVITMLIVAVCASVGCFQCLCLACLTEPRWERKRKRASEREWETSEQCAERVFFFLEQCALCSDQRDSCLIQTPKGTAGGAALCLCVGAEAWTCFHFTSLLNMHSHTYIHLAFFVCLPDSDPLFCHPVTWKADCAGAH